MTSTKQGTVSIDVQTFAAKAVKQCQKCHSGHLVTPIPLEFSSQDIETIRNLVAAKGFNAELDGSNFLELSR